MKALIQQEGKRPTKCIVLEQHDSKCRCCGHGRMKLCNYCYGLLRQGYAFFIEVRDDSTPEKKWFTNYQIAFIANRAYLNGQPGVPMEPGIYFIRESDLKQFLGNGYKTTTPATGVIQSGFIGVPKWRGSGPQAGTGDSSRGIVELVSDSR